MRAGLLECFTQARDDAGIEAIVVAGAGRTFCGGADSTPTSPEVLGRLAAGMQSGDRARAIRTTWDVNVSQAMAGDEAHAKPITLAEWRQHSLFARAREWLAPASVPLY